MRLYLGKLQYAVEEVLTERHLATSGPKGDLLLRNEVAQIVFAITAKHVANTALRTEDVRVLPQTDREVSLSHAYGELDPSDRYRCRELLISGVYLFPGDMVSFEDIVQFRMRYRGELLELRAEIDRLLDNVRNSPEPLDAIQSARQGMQIAVQRVGRAARGRHISFLSSAGYGARHRVCRESTYGPRHSPVGLRRLWSCRYFSSPRFSHSTRTWQQDGSLRVPYASAQDLRLTSPSETDIVL